MRTLAISDIHGSLLAFNQLLAMAEYDARKDRLILLGDYVDSGIQSMEVIAQIQVMMQQGDVIALRGNHDQSFVDLMRAGADPSQIASYMTQGGKNTVLSYLTQPDQQELLTNGEYEKVRTFIAINYKNQLQFLEQLPLNYETENHIFVHAGLDPAYKDWKEQPARNYMNISDDFYEHPTLLDKIVVFGHTKTRVLQNSNDVWFGGDKIGIDGGYAYGYQLNCLIIQSNSQYETVYISR